jgi:hypothetical protein
MSTIGAANCIGTLLITCVVMAAGSYMFSHNRALGKKLAAAALVLL